MITKKEKKEKLEKVKLKLILSDFYIFPLLGQVRFIFINKNEAYTDGRNIFLGPKYFKDEETLRFIVHHEILHILLEHIERFETLKDERLRYLWNIATDLIINYYLLEERNYQILEELKEKIVTPENLGKFWYLNAYSLKILAEKGTAEEIYRYLLKQIKEESRKSLSEAVKEMKEMFDGDLRKTPQQNFGDSSSGGGDIYNPENIEEQESLKRAIETAKQLFKSSQSRGLLPGEIKSLIERLKTRNKVNWKFLLRNRLKKDLERITTYNIINKKKSSLYRYKFLYPGKKKKNNKISLFISIDVSGSVPDRSLSEFMNEIEYILRNYNAEITLLYHDVRIQKTLSIDSKSLSKVEKMYNITGRGGTSHSEVLEFLRKVEQDEARKSIIIIFSDFISDLTKKDVITLRRKFHDIILIDEELRILEPEDLDKGW